MQRLRVELRVLLAVLVAVVARIVRRVIRGPALPSWSWSTELTLVTARALVDATSQGADRSARRGLERSFDPAVPKPLRGLIAVQPDSAGGIPGEWHRRTDGLDTAGVMLYLHGGAYVAGSPATHRRFVARLAWETRTDAFVPDYRLAPEYRFPAAVDDAVAAYSALVESGVSPDRIVVAGDSAGGGLACALILHLLREKGPLPAGTILFSPYTDLEHTGMSIVRNAATDYLPRGEQVRSNIEYLGDADPHDPLASPLYGDFSDGPPMLIFAGSAEMILDDSTRLAENATGQGADVSLVIEPDMFHVWPALLPHHPATTRTLARCADFAATCTSSPES